MHITDVVTDRFFNLLIILNFLMIRREVDYLKMAKVKFKKSSRMCGSLQDGEDFLLSSGIRSKLEANGYSFRWVHPKNIMKYEAESYETIFEIDKEKRKYSHWYVGTMMAGDQQT